MKDRATNQVKTQVVEKTDAPTLQGFVHRNTNADTQVYTDEARAYNGLNRPHEAVKHSVGEYVKEQVHTTGLKVIGPCSSRDWMGFTTTSASSTWAGTPESLRDGTTPARRTPGRS